MCARVYVCEKEQIPSLSKILPIFVHDNVIATVQKIPGLSHLKTDTRSRDRIQRRPPALFFADVLYNPLHRPVNLFRVVCDVVTCHVCPRMAKT